MREMKKHIYIYITFIFVGISNVNAQDYFSFYNLGDYVVQTQNISPVFIPKSSFTFAVPGANSGIGLNAGFKINELLVQNGATNRIDLENLYNETEDANNLNLDLSVNLFYMAFKRERGSLTIFANTRVTNDFRYSKDFLQVAAYGIQDDFSLQEQNNLTAYNEFGVGFTQTFLDDKLAVAVRVKYLNGITHSSIEEGAQVSLMINDETRDYTISAENATVNSAGSIFTNSDEFKIFTGNTGFGFDFGATFKATKKLTFEIAVNDIGSITWKEDIKNYNILDATNDVYSGIDLRTQTDLGQEFLDVLSDVYPNTETEVEFDSKLTMKSYVSARYALTEKNLFTLAAFNSSAFDEFKPSYSLGYNRTLNKNTFGVLTSMGGINNDLSFGANFAVNLGPVQLYAAADRLIFGKIEEASQLNFRLGLNLVFGYNK